jgi:hypothetical protein
VSRVPFAYAPDGSVLVMGDGPELFAFGANDGPLWKKFTDGVIVGVGGNSTTVMSVDSDGRLIAWRGVDGEKLDENTVDAPGVRGLAMRPDGTCAVIAKDAVVITTARGGGNTLAVKGACAAAWGPKGELAVGAEDGGLCVFDAAGKAIGSTKVSGAVTGLTYRSPAHWLVAAGTKVTLVAADGKSAGASVDAAGPTGDVACTHDGAIFAVMAGPQQVTIGELATNKRIGTVTYQRDVSGVGFGQQAWLAVGLDESEANRIDLSTGQICKTEPAHGKAGSKWALTVAVEPQNVRTAITTVRTSGKAIATFIDHTPSSGPSSGCLYSCLAFAAGTFACSGCSGIIAALYYFVYLP